MTSIRTHTAPVSSAAASPDGGLVASGSYDRTILLWDAASGGVRRSLQGHTSLINGLDWSPDGTLLASAASDHTARVWRVDSGETSGVLRGHSDDVNAVRWSPSGMLLATASFDGSVRVWTRDGDCLLIAMHHASDVNGVDWLPDGRRLAAASDDGTVSVFDLDTGRVRRLLRGHEDWVDQVAVHPDGTRLASASQDGTVGIWDLARGTRTARLAASTCVVKDVAWSQDGRQLAATSYDGCIRVYGADDLGLQTVHRAEGLWNRSVDFGPHGLVTGSFGGGPVLLGPEGARRYGTETTRGLNGFAVAPDGARVALCCDDGRLYEVDLARQRVVARIEAHAAAVLCADFSPDGRLIASGSWDRTVSVWDRQAEQVVARWAGRGDPINTLCFGADGRTLWIGTFNGEVLRWTPGCETAERVGAHDGSVKQIRATRDRVVSVGRDGMVRSWGTSASFSAGASIVNGVALANRPGRLATVSRRSGLEIWSDDGRALAGYREHACSAKSVAWSADDTTLAAAYYDGRLAVWQPETGHAHVQTLSDASLSQVSFAGSQILASSWDADGSLHVLDRTGRHAQTISVAA